MTISKGERLGSMLIDHISMTFVFLFLGVAINPEFPATGNSENSFRSNMLFSLGLAIYICKDTFSGRSIGKRLLKFQIMDNEKCASPIQCAIRNLTSIIWPIEALVALINPSRRLGDRISKTRLVKTGKPISGEIVESEIAIAFLISILYSYLITSLVWNIF